MDVEEIIDRLYALPLEEFTPARNQAERELRQAGEREQADRVKALRKPTAAAGAVNRLVRSHRAQVEAFLCAAATLRDAQVAGRGDLAAAARAERAALERLVALGGETVRPTLQAAAVDDDTARELLEARLVREPEPAGFGTLLAYAKPAPGRSATATPRRGEPTAAKPAATKPPAVRPAPVKRGAATPPRPDDRAARARLQDAKRMLTAASAEERQARRRWTQTQRELEKAQAAVEKARRDLDHLHSR
jgi:hypothetical protein